MDDQKEKVAKMDRFLKLLYVKLYLSVKILYSMQKSVPFFKEANLSGSKTRQLANNTDQLTIRA